MLKRIFKLFNFWSDIKSSQTLMENSFSLSNLYGAARSIIALSLLSSMIFNSVDILFPNSLLEDPRYGESWSMFFLLANHLVLAKWITIIVLLIVVSGYFPRFTGVLQWYVSYSFINSSPIIEGGDQLAAIISLFLIPVTLMDGRRNHWSPITNFELNEKNKIKNITSYFVFMVIKIQVMVVYFHSAIGKIAVNEWADGTALYYWLLNPLHGSAEWLRPTLAWLISNGFVLTMLTWSVVIFELLLSLTILTSPLNLKFRKRMLVAGVLFHLAIILVHGLVSFCFTMTGALILFVIPIGYEFALKSNIKYHIYLKKLK